jgi:NAD(P)-dependent dehydrogenase (short-subunit alcohol dehydrogenase family)
MKKVALVTGVSKGIGQAIAGKLISEEYFVHGVYNTGRKESEKFKNEAKDIEIYQVNLRDRKQTQGLIETLKSVKFDVLVNNAGIFQLENFDNYDFEIWDSTFEINLNAILVLCLGLKDSIKKGGAIVNIASTDGGPKEVSE